MHLVARQHRAVVRVVAPEDVAAAAAVVRDKVAVGETQVAAVLHRPSTLGTRSKGVALGVAPFLLLFSCH